MKFTINSTILLKRLSAINGIISSSPIVPILDNFLFKVKKDELEIIASDLQTFISTKVKIESAISSSIAIPSKILLETLKNLPEQSISFMIEEKSYVVEITSASGRYKLACENAEDFPISPDISTSDGSFKINNYILKKGINKLLFATASNELKPALEGVFINIDKEVITFVATDGHKLAKYKFNSLQNEKGNYSFIIPKKPLSIITGMPLIDKDQEAKIHFTKSHIFFNFGYTQVTSRFINENFPPYSNVLPENSPHIISIDKNDFINSLKRVSIYANRSTRQVKLKFFNNETTIFTEDVAFSTEASESLHCDYQGEELTIGFNSKFLIESLSKIDEDVDEVKLHMGEPYRAVLVFPKNQKPDEELLLLVMPVILSEEVKMD